MAISRLSRWFVLFVALCGAMRATATPTFSFTVTCPPSSTYNWRVIASSHSDMTSAFTVSINGSFNASMTYPLTQGPSSGNVSGYGSQELYFVYQVQFPDLTWYQLGAILGPVTADGGFVSTFDFTPPNCLPTNSSNPDIPFWIGNMNPWGGYPNPKLPGGDPLPPPSDWPVPPPSGPGSPGGGGWPPYIPPGGGTNIIINITNFNAWGISGPGDISWPITPGAPPVFTNNISVTNLTTTVTNVNGTNMTITVTNVSNYATTGGGLPSGGNGSGSAADGTELLSALALERLIGIEANTRATTNVLTEIRDNATNSPPESEWSGLFAEQRAAGEAAAAPITNLLQIPVFDGNSGLGQSGPPTLSYSIGGRIYTITPGHINISGILASFRTFCVYLIWAFTAWACWSSIESNIKMIINAQQFGTASKGAGGIVVSIIKKALGVAAVIVTVWMGAVTAIMFHYGPLATYLTINPMSYLSGFPYITWLNSLVPVSEVIIAVFAYVAFRIVSYAAAVFATIVSRFMVGL